MSRLSEDSTIIQGTATKLAGDATAVTTLSTAVAGSPAAVLDIADGIVADPTAVAALNLGASAPLAVARGTGADGNDNYTSRATLEATGLRKVEILIDIDGFVSEATDNDVIGDSAAANAYIAQVTAAEFGTVLGGTVECLQAPTGGEIDIDLYADASGTIAAGADGTGDTALLQSAADWTIGLKQTMTGVPAANDFLYLTVGTASTPTAGTYTAGIFLITFYGV